ncbi:MAG: PrgI family protein [Patescibacteria group bacterium]|nr:PrgI family protein [Patescibacteria group bacterium]
MQFTLPQFIEHETKIIGSLTFKQCGFIGAAAGVCLILYFSIGKTNFFLFVILSIFIFGLALALAFLKIGGKELPTVLKNFLQFNLGSKIYIWKKNETPITVFKKAEIKKEVKGKEPFLRIGEKSQLKKIRTEIEIKTK